MFDFVDTSGLPDAKALFAEAEARRDPDRELRAPVSIVAGSVVDAVAVLVERGVVADPGPGVAARRDGVGGDDPASRAVPVVRVVLVGGVRMAVFRVGVGLTVLVLVLVLWMLVM
jgi:hypothetical protein